MTKEENERWDVMIRDLGWAAERGRAGVLGRSDVSLLKAVDQELKWLRRHLPARFENAPETAGPCLNCGKGMAEHTQWADHPTWFLCPKKEA